MGRKYFDKAFMLNKEYIEDIIEGYHTLNVDGRESLSSELKTIDINDQDGAKFDTKRYLPRKLTISFIIEGGTNTELLGKLDLLNKVLEVEEADIIFRDELDKFYVGTRSGDPEFSISLGVAMGKFNIVCNDPFKYSVELFQAEATNDEEGKSFIIDYGGTHETYPILQTRFKEAGDSDGEYSDDGDCGYIAFSNNDNSIIQLGNPTEVDVETQFTESDNLINCKFSTVHNWETNVGKLIGTASITGMPIMASFTDSTWGKKWIGSTIKADHGTGTGWHGPTISRRPTKGTLGAGASDFTFSWEQKFHTTDKNKKTDRGCFQAVLSNDDGTIIAGVKIYKGSSSTTGYCEYWTNGTSQARVKIDLSYYNLHFGRQKRTKKNKKWKYTYPKLSSSIVKKGNKVTFKIGKLTTRTFITDTTKQAHRVTFFIGSYGSATTYMTTRLLSCKFRRDNTENFLDIKNCFAAGDMVTIDVDDMEIYLTRQLPDTIDPEEPGIIIVDDYKDIGERSPELGALGNDWETFTLKPGVNQINCQWSDWIQEGYEPEFKMMWREVFL